MTPQQNFQIRVNLIDLVAEYVQATCLPGPEDDAENPLLQLLAIYREDTIRRMQGQPGNLDYMRSKLKIGVRLAGTLMAQIQESDSDLLVGWHYGAQPQNMMQRLYNLLFETSLELTSSIMAVEALYPALKAEFDLERAAYQRIHLQWQAEDEAERQQNA